MVRGEAASLRFIPAWAGNSKTTLLRPLVEAVHPRMGGEQDSVLMAGRVISGSSPHGRGTGPEHNSQTPSSGFIPAWAGNRVKPEPFDRNIPVHPRMGGEQPFNTNGQDFPSGSSPHGRGTAEAGLEALRDQRFIPAWAGNSQPPFSEALRPSVHPRMGGEQCHLIDRWNMVFGSSPHGRGTDFL